MSKFLPPRLIFSQENCEPGATFRFNDGKIYISSAQSYFDEYYDREIRPLFENAVEVYGAKYDSSKGWAFDQQGILPNETTHRTLLIPIKKVEESAEDILTAFAKCNLVNIGYQTELQEIHEKAKAFLAKKEKK